MIEFYTIGVIGVLAALSPGPDFIVVSKNALTYSRQAGCCSALGIATGVLIHSAYCILGLAVIISHSLLLFSIIRYFGATYLIYLGVKSLLTKKIIATKIAKQPVTLANRQAFTEGFLVNLLNPKCIIFMLSVFTIIVKPHTAYETQIIYGLELSVIAILWFCFLSAMLTHKKVKQQINKIQYVVMKIMGVFLVILGLDLLLSTHK